MTIPHRGVTGQSTYFVTANVFERKSLFRVDKIARLFIEVLFGYRTQKKYLLHEFVVMPDHFHLILTPTGITLERAGQLVKGGFSFQLNTRLKVKKDVWQPSFVDRRIRDCSNMRDSRTTFGRTRKALPGEVAGGISLQLG